MTEILLNVLYIYLGICVLAGLYVLRELFVVDSKFGINYKCPLFWVTVLFYSLPIVNLYFFYLDILAWWKYERGHEFDERVFQILLNQNRVMIPYTVDDRKLYTSFHRCMFCKYLEDGSRLDEWTQKGSHALTCPVCSNEAANISAWNIKNNIGRQAKHKLKRMSYLEKLCIAVIYLFKPTKEIKHDSH